MTTVTVYSPTLIRPVVVDIEFVSVQNSNLAGEGVWVEAAGGPIQGDHCCVCVARSATIFIAQLYFYRVYSCKDEGTIVRECSV